MKCAAAESRVAIVGASSLLGKELRHVLAERRFPVSRLVTFEADEEEPPLPIVDLRENVEAAVTDEDLTEADLDFAFLAARPGSVAAEPAFLRELSVATAPHCVVIDLGEGTAELPGGVLSIPALDRSAPGGDASRPGRDTRFFVSAQPAAIVISHVLLRLAAHFEVKRAVAQVFAPASEMGPQAIEELQKQTVNLLSFQKIPQSVFGAQLAFNVLPRMGRRRHGLTDLESRIRNQLRQYLGSRVPRPALRLFQVPVFHSLALSLYVETASPTAPEALGKALEGDRLHLRRSSEQAPSQVEAAGSSDILVDAITPDAEHPAGIWIWAVADNLRLAAVNAVEIAEAVRERIQSSTLQ